MRTRTVSKSKQRPKDNQRAEDIANAGGRVGIPISKEHAQLAATWGDSLYLAFDVVRAIDYQAHEPSNVFNPVRPIDDPSERTDR